MNGKVIVSVLVVAFAMAAFADTHTWVGGGSLGGGWSVAANWRNESGEAECPSSGDTAVFNQNETVVVNDDDAALFCSLKRVKLDLWVSAEQKTIVVLDVSTNVLVGCAVNGRGRFVKRGEGAATLDSTCQEDVSVTYGRWSIYDVLYDGIVVDAGTLVLPQGKGFLYGLPYGGLSVSEGATVVLPDNQEFGVGSLRGDGTVVQRGDTVRNLVVGIPNAALSEMAVFGGKLSGKIKILSYAWQAFTGGESDMTGDFMIYQGTSLESHSGVTGLSHLGTKNQPSSIGKGNWVYLMYLGNLLYLGEGETTDRNIQIDTRSNGYHANGIDGGPHGGLRITGSLEWASWGAGGNECWWQNSFLLAGSNAAPCTLAGPLKLKIDHGTTNFYHYIIKQGPGTWGIEENAATTFRGVFDVREGTFQFNSLREAGTLCALGYGDVLTEEYYGKYNPDKASPYALRLGAPGSTNAVLEYVGSGKGVSTTRKLLLNGDGHLRATSGILDFGGVCAAAGEKTLVLDGVSTGENTLRDVTDGDGTLSVAKEGAGAWYLVGGKTSFTGDLSVREGTLKLYKRDIIHRYFRIAFLDGYGNPNGCYIKEFALYDAEGKRHNLNLQFAKPDTVAWRKNYFPSKVARTLEPGYMGFDSLNDEKGCGAYTYEPPEQAALIYLCDGTSVQAQFANAFSTTSPGVVSMRLADDCPEIVAMDFCQSTGHYGTTAEKAQTASKFRLESSSDGISWTTVVEQENLPLNTTENVWYYSESGLKVGDAPRDRILGDGEGLPFSARALTAAVDEPVTDLSSVRSVSVAAGATLSADPLSPVTVSRIRIDVDAGSGAFKNVLFAENMTIDVTGLPPRQSLAMAVDFGDIANFDAVKSWTFLEDGQPVKGTATLTRTRLEIIRPGLVVIIR